MRYPFCVLIWLLIFDCSNGQISVRIPHEYDFGTISTDSLARNPIGTGFLVGRKTVMTCGHVIDGLDQWFYYPYNSKRSFRIVVSKKDSLHDLALLSCNEIICSRY